MPRYMIERTFPNGLGLTPTPEGKKTADAVIAANAQYGVTWVHSYVTSDRRNSYCIYDAPSVDAARRVAEINGLPLNKISEVRVLDPYFLV